jgi:CubicO group peptidase (beta-lactamase class C family)
VPRSTLFLLCVVTLLTGSVAVSFKPYMQDAAPAEVGLDPVILTRMDAHIREQLPHVRSVLVSRRGRLVFEQYYGDVSQETLQNIQSMMKSVSSALVGIALRKGQITSLDNKALDYLPEYRDIITDQRVRSITIRHLLTMTSGLGAANGSFDKILTHPVPDILRQQLLNEPGSGFRYSDLGAHLLGAVLEKATGTPVMNYSQTQLFGPLGVRRFLWYGDNTGIRSGGFSGLFRAQDILKLGELYLRKGNWNGVEIISPAYVADSITIHASGDFYGETAQYGYMWWITTVAGQAAFYARGYGGQYLMVLPKSEMVILCTSDWKQPEYPEHYALVGKFILPAVMPNK